MSLVKSDGVNKAHLLWFSMSASEGGPGPLWDPEFLRGSVSLKDTFGLAPGPGMVGQGIQVTSQVLYPPWGWRLHYLSSRQIQSQSLAKGFLTNSNDYTTFRFLASEYKCIRMI